MCFGSQNSESFDTVATPAGRTNHGATHIVRRGCQDEEGGFVPASKRKDAAQVLEETLSERERRIAEQEQSVQAEAVGERMSNLSRSRVQGSQQGRAHLRVVRRMAVSGSLPNFCWCERLFHRASCAG